LPNHSVDVAISLLSFRYLDWDPMLAELVRVLKPTGRILVVDMVTAPVKFWEYPMLLRSKWRHYQDRKRQPQFYQNLRKLVAHPGWKHMLKYNPIRSQREMQTYLESRFPGQKATIINIGLHSRILAFDSGPVSNYSPSDTQYP
ncbi:MAG: methyltransferase domain-containing protein, partial [Bacteroidota bacterium]